MQVERLLNLSKASFGVLLGWIAVADVLLRARVMTYSADEIYNLDAIVTFLTTADYTTRGIGGFPFEPAMSSGVLITWIHGLTYILGGSLYAARAATGLVFMTAANALAYRFFRSRAISRIDSGLLAVGLWVALLRVISHETRIVHPGELGAFVFLLAGTLVAARSAQAAALLWGLAVWLGKIIYLPFSIALVFAAGLDRVRVLEGRAGIASAAATWARIAVAFSLPLLAWMLLIWVRYDFSTLLGWCFSYAAFIIEHGSGRDVDLGGLPALAGWRFDPGWPAPIPFLRLGLDVTLPSLIPLATGPVAALGLALLVRRRVVSCTTAEIRYIAAATFMVIAFGAWFFAFDPTQWDRHLLPAVYVSVAVAVYCATKIWVDVRPLRPFVKLLGLAAMLALVYLGAAHARAYAAEVEGTASFARTCRGQPILAPPCWQESARTRILELIHELCGIPGGSFDEHCVRKKRAELLQRSLDSADTEPYAAGYMALFVQRWGYRYTNDFPRDLAALLCARSDTELRDYLEESGLDMERILSVCASDESEPDS